jgi:hypothetical protein
MSYGQPVESTPFGCKPRGYYLIDKNARTAGKAGSCVQRKKPALQKKNGTTWGIMHGAACEKNVASPDFIKGALLLVFPSLYPRLLP